MHLSIPIALPAPAHPQGRACAEGTSAALAWLAVAFPVHRPFQVRADSRKEVPGTAWDDGHMPTVAGPRQSLAEEPCQGAAGMVASPAAARTGARVDAGGAARLAEGGMLLRLMLAPR